MTHTPGKWKSTPNAHHDLGCMIGAELSPDTKDQKRHIGWAYNEDNARLIAAAPDLLSKLQMMVDIFNNSEPDPMQAFAAIEQARAAIEKATK